jgi:hypothetical protein
MKSLAFAALVAGSWIIASSAIANADSQVEGNYATIEACQADGANGQFTGPDSGASSYYCEQGADGLYYLYLTN